MRKKTKNEQFDTAMATEWKTQIEELESKLATQTKEIESHIEAIAILENQKLDLMQGSLLAI